MEVPTYPEPLFITDAAINIFPDLETKADIIRNVIDLHHGLGLGEPRVAILSAVEQVTPSIPSTIEAAALCKMADRGQIAGGLLDGPLALDNAISRTRPASGHTLARGGRGPGAGGAGPGGRQHAGQEPHLPGQCRGRRHRAGRARPSS